MYEINRDEFQRQRGKWHTAFRLITGFGAIMWPIDWFTRFPTPVRGEFTCWWMIIIALGLWCGLRYRRLPYYEAWKLLRAKRGYTADYLARLGLSLAEARRIMERFVANEDAQVVEPERIPDLDGTAEMHDPPERDGDYAIEIADIRELFHDWDRAWWKAIERKLGRTEPPARQAHQAPSEEQQADQQPDESAAGADRGA